MKKRYFKTNRLTSLYKYLHDGTVLESHDIHCCEVVKESFNRTKQIKLQQPAEEIAYTQEEINIWVNLLKQNKFKFEYIIDEKYHSIILNSFDFYGIQDMYLTMVLVRYLWYAENDGLIDRIFDILKNERNLGFLQALFLAQFYDNTDRNSVFNLCYENTVPLRYEFHFKQLEAKNSINDHLLCLSGHNRVLDQLRILLSNLLLKEITKLITKGESYIEIWRFYTTQISQFSLPNFIYNYDRSSFLEKFGNTLSLILNKKVKITLVKELELNENYIFLNYHHSLRGAKMGVYKGLSHKQLGERYNHYREIVNNHGDIQIINMHDDSIIFKLEYQK